VPEVRLEFTTLFPCQSAVLQGLKRYVLYRYGSMCTRCSLMSSMQWSSYRSVRGVIAMVHRRGIFGGVRTSFESTEVVWWQLMQLTADVLRVENVASWRRYFTGEHPLQCSGGIRCSSCCCCVFFYSGYCACIVCSSTAVASVACEAECGIYCRL